MVLANPWKLDNEDWKTPFPFIFSLCLVRDGLISLDGAVPAPMPGLYNHGCCNGLGTFWCGRNRWLLGPWPFQRQRLVPLHTCKQQVENKLSLGAATFGCWNPMQGGLNFYFHSQGRLPHYKLMFPCPQHSVLGFFFLRICILLLNPSCNDSQWTPAMPPKRSLLQLPHQCSVPIKVKGDWG